MADCEDEDRAVVIDNGSSCIKAGFAGDDLPTYIFPSIVGYPKPKRFYGMGGPSASCGDEAYSKRDWLDNKHPIEYGLIINWDYMEKIWHHTFYNELRVGPEEHAILLTEIPLNLKLNREKMTQIMFETFNVPSYYVIIGAVLTLYASGRTTGVVIESGSDVTHIVPCYEGYCLNHVVCRMDIGGRDVSDYLSTMLKQKGYDFAKVVTDENALIENIKETQSFVAMDYFKQIETENLETKYELPDGQVINIGTERFQCAEILFQPQLIGLEANKIHIIDWNRMEQTVTDGIPKLIYDSIHRCDDDIKNELFGNIIFGGGNTMFKGFEQRLVKEIDSLVSRKTLIDGFVRRYYLNNSKKLLYKDIVALMNKYTSFEAKINAPSNREYSAWIGGSMLSALSTFEEMWIRKEEYDEAGPSIVHRKCT